MSELRCSDCGDLMEFSEPSMYPGTNEPTLVVEACCDTEDTQIILTNVRETIDEELKTKTLFAYILEVVPEKDKEVIKQKLTSIESNIEDMLEKVKEALHE